MEDVLDEALTQLIEEGTNPEKVLSCYPEETDQLQPLLEMAIQVQETHHPKLSPVAVALLRRRLFEAVSRRITQGGSIRRRYMRP